MVSREKERIDKAEVVKTGKKGYNGGEGTERRGVMKGKGTPRYVR